MVELKIILNTLAHKQNLELKLTKKKKTPHVLGDNIQKAGARRYKQSQGKPGLHCKFQARLGYRVSICLKNKPPPKKTHGTRTGQRKRIEMTGFFCFPTGCLLGLFFWGNLSQYSGTRYIDHTTLKLKYWPASASQVLWQCIQPCPEKEEVLKREQMGVMGARKTKTNLSHMENLNLTVCKYEMKVEWGTGRLEGGKWKAYMRKRLQYKIP